MAIEKAQVDGEIEVGQSPDAESDGEFQGGLTATLVGRRVMNSAPVRWLASLPIERRDVAIAVLFSLVVTIPFLGSVGMWDPWEVHYGEVAREMVDRQNYVFPYWEGAYFFSKPALTMWMQAIGIAATGSLAKGFGPLGLYLEWGMRIPFALLSALSVGLVTLAIGRVFNRRSGLLAGFATATSPFWFMLSRQTVTDTPFVMLLTCGMACFLVAEFDPAVRDDRKRATGWWCFAYAFFALSALAKGLLGVALPGALIFLYMLVSWDWALVKRARLLQGLVVVALVALPWYLTLSLFTGVDDESMVFPYRFFVHDHFRRLGEGVHTTTPGGTFIYFIEQLGFGLYPWVALLPGAAVLVGRIKLKDKAPQSRALLLIAVWAIASFFLFTFSKTKFHHYCFPVVPPLAILCALYADSLWRKGFDRNAIPILLGLGFLAAIGQNLVFEPKRLIDLFIYQYDRAYPMRELDPRMVLSVIFAGGGALCFAAFLGRSRRVLFASFGALAMAFTIYVSWIHWPQLTFHWSQRDVIWSYYQQRKDYEPIAAWYLNWRGETFYTSNTVRQLADAKKVDEFLAQKGRLWFILERSKYAGMKTQVESKGRAVRIADRSNNKYYLVLAEEKAPAPTPTPAPEVSPAPEATP